MEITELAELLSIPKLPSYLSQVERQLHDVFSSAHPAIAAPALRLITSGGKRLRSVLVIAASASQGASIDADVITAASAIELVHLGSIVHDDVLDHAKRRGSEPTIYAKEGINSAILIGDYLLAEAAHQAAAVNAAAASVVARAITQMCEGQIQENVDAYNPQRSIADYQASIANKTGALMGAACQVGGLCAKAPTPTVQALQDYGKTFGVAFQLVDDLLDFLATSETMGKPVHNDMKEGVYTLPLLLSLYGPTGASVQSWLGRQPKQPVAHSVVVQRLLQDGSFTATVAEITKQNGLAASALEDIGSHDTVGGLQQLPELYLKHALGKQTLFAPAS